MTNKQTGGPAFPAPAGVSHITEQGMTLRDYAAIKAMQSLILDSFYQKEGAYKGWSEFGHEVAEDAYIMADEMLKARDVKT
jgi:hypothetical protein